MDKICKSCRIKFNCIVNNTKYCNDCKLKIRKRQIKEWQLKNKITKHEFDLYCFDCFKSLPISVKQDKLYCDECAKKRYRITHNNLVKSKNRMKKLKIFYKNLLINFIDAPYINSKHKRLIKIAN